MADMIADGLAWLADELKDNCSGQITYLRGNSSATIQATFDTQILRVTDGQGNTKIERPDADFVFKTIDLDFGAGPVEPMDGDIIQVVFGSVTKQFRAMKMLSDPSWRYCDPFQLEVRVHTKFIGTF